MNEHPGGDREESAPEGVQYIDSHAHLYFDRFDEDRAEVIERARSGGFATIVNVGIDVESSRAAVDLARAYPDLCRATVGLHPNSSGVDEAELTRTVEELATIAREHRDVVVAVGEIGLDYYWDHATPAQQAISFRRQLALAAEVELPVIIHCREAWSDTLDIVAELEGEPGATITGVFHCFGGTVAEAERALELGWCISFAGNVTYPRAQDLRDAAAIVPAERLLLETDAPFLAPQPVRGQRNEPSFALHTATALSELRGVTREELGVATTANARRLFRLLCE